MTISVKGIPPSLNDVVGKESGWKYRDAKKEWTDAVCWLGKSVAPSEPFKKASVTITYFFPTRARHDADNYCGKFLLDGLTKAGIIADDDMKHITLTIKGEYDKRNPRTEIEVINEA